MKIHDYSQEESLLSHYVAQLRDVSVQRDRMRFRCNISRIGKILGYEMSKELNYAHNDITTPNGVKNCAQISDQVVICSILRAGIPLHNGLLDFFDDAGNTFISAYRRHLPDSHDFDIVVEYVASPSLEGKTLVIADIMLASGQSMIAAYEALKKYGTPRAVHVISVLGCEEGVANIQEYFNDEIPSHLWIASVDSELNIDKYIVPGLGDAGDLCFGEKL